MSHLFGLGSADDVTIDYWWRSQWPDNCDMNVWKVITNLLHIDFIHSNIHSQSCKKETWLMRLISPEGHMSSFSISIWESWIYLYHIPKIYQHPWCSCLSAWLKAYLLNINSTCQFQMSTCGSAVIVNKRTYLYRYCMLFLVGEKIVATMELSGEIQSMLAGKTAQGVKEITVGDDWDQGWGLLSQYLPFRYFSSF